MEKRHKPMFKLIVRRKEKGLTQGELAALIGIERYNICNYETGVSRPRTETLEKLAAALDCAAGDLI